MAEQNPLLADDLLWNKNSEVAKDAAKIPLTAYVGRSVLFELTRFWLRGAERSRRNVLLLSEPQIWFRRLAAICDFHTPEVGIWFKSGIKQQIPSLDSGIQLSVPHLNEPVLQMRV